MSTRAVGSGAVAPPPVWGRDRSRFHPFQRRDQQGCISNWSSAVVVEICRNGRIRAARSSGRPSGLHLNEIVVGRRLERACRSRERETVHDLTQIVLHLHLECVLGTGVLDGDRAGVPERRIQPTDDAIAAFTPRVYLRVEPPLDVAAKRVEQHGKRSLEEALGFALAVQPVDQCLGKAARDVRDRPDGRRAQRVDRRLFPDGWIEDEPERRDLDVFFGDLVPARVDEVEVPAPRRARRRDGSETHLQPFLDLVELEAGVARFVPLDEISGNQHVGRRHVVHVHVRKSVAAEVEEQVVGRVFRDVLEALQLLLDGRPRRVARPSRQRRIFGAEEDVGGRQLLSADQPVAKRQRVFVGAGKRAVEPLLHVGVVFDRDDERAFGHEVSWAGGYGVRVASATNSAAAAADTAPFRYMNSPVKWRPTTAPVSSAMTGEPELPPSVEQS